MKFTLNPNQKRLPIGGHHYPCHGLTFRAETFDEVVSQLREYRVVNGISVGKPRMEVINFYSLNWPYMVRIETEEGEPEEEPSNEYLNWRSWIQKTWTNPPKTLVTNKEAQIRFDKCKGCPFNKKNKWPRTDEVRELERRAFMLRRGQNAGDFVGPYCGFHKADIAVFGYLERPLEYSAKNEEDEFDFCFAQPVKGK